MPMLALLLLCAGLFGSDADAGDSSLRGQILQAEAEAGHASAPSALRGSKEAAPVQLYHLRHDRVLCVGNRQLQSAPMADQQQYPGSTRFAQLWERVDGQWKLQRMVSIDDLVARH